MLLAISQLNQNQINKEYEKKHEKELQSLRL